MVKRFIMWCLGYSLVDSSSTPTQNSSSSTSATSTNVEPTTEELLKEYNTLVSSNGNNSQEAWNSIVKKYNWNEEKARKKLSEISGFGNSNTKDNNSEKKDSEVIF